MKRNTVPVLPYPEIVLAVMLACAFVLRAQLYLHNYPVTSTLDPAWEYLLSSHIVSYHEFPLVGTKAFQGSLSINSPSYLYLLAFPLLFNNSIVMLYALNILLQIAFIYLVFRLTTRLFSTSAGLLVAIFLSFSDFGLEFSKYFFQPHIMQPFFVSSILLFIYGTKRERPGVMYAGVAMYVFSISLYFSAAAYVPLFAAVSFWAIRKRPNAATQMRNILLTAVLSFAALFGSTVYGALISHSFSTGAFVSFIVRTLPEYVNNMQGLSFVQIHSLFSRFAVLHLSSLSIPILYPALLLLVISYGLTQPAKRHTRTVFILALGFLTPLIVQPFFRLSISSHYMHLSSLFLLMLICGLSAHLLRKKTYWKTISIVSIIILFHNTVQGHNYRRNAAAVTAGTLAAREILNTATTMQLFRNGNPDFSIIRTGKENGPDYQYWQLLEQLTGEKYVRSERYKGKPVTPFGQYVFISCLADPPPLPNAYPNDCDSYLKRHPNMAFIKPVYSTSPFTVYLAKDIAFTDTQ